MSDTAALRRRIESGEQDTLTAAEYVALATAEAKRGNKYHAERTEIAGEWFDSAAEARRWGELQLLLREGEISHLRRQVPYRLKVRGVQVATYVADFVYLDMTRGQVVEDVKGYRTPEYKLKAKLMWAVHGIRIVEVS